jgi:hypothetical protein
VAIRRGLSESWSYADSIDGASRLKKVKINVERTWGEKAGEVCGLQARVNRLAVGCLGLVPSLVRGGETWPSWDASIYTCSSWGKSTGTALMRFEKCLESSPAESRSS